MAYKAMLKIIEVNKERYTLGHMSDVEYEIFRFNTVNKLDVFLACERLTAEQYEELVRKLEVSKAEALI